MKKNNRNGNTPKSLIPGKLALSTEELMGIELVNDEQEKREPLSFGSLINKVKKFFQQIECKQLLGKNTKFSLA
jgi:hypothetical protein